MVAAGENCAVFCKVAEEFGGLSNMHNGYPLLVNGLEIGSCEALYQACRFPDHPEIQTEIIEAPHAYAAKLASRKAGRHERFARPDWDTVRVDVMRWCLAIKPACNFEEFARPLRSTGERPIVERSLRDDFWGAKSVGKVLVGTNALGKLLMELREGVRHANRGDRKSVV